MASSECDEPPVRTLKSRGVGHIHLARPERYNALNEVMLDAVSEAAQAFDTDKEIRAVLLSSEGGFFCAGADIAYMRRAAGYTRQENIADAHRLSAMYETLDSLSKPLFARVQGPAFGGGVGLAAVADFVFVGPDATFSLSEVKLGILPAVIAPYVVRRVGIARARGLFGTGWRIHARDAVALGLADFYCADEEELDTRIHSLLKSTLSCGPLAVARSRRIPNEVWRSAPGEVVDAMAELSADARASEEGREGLSAFLEKRSPEFSRPLDGSSLLGDGS
jgi:methylglutaconyl-CoA hydratase